MNHLVLIPGLNDLAAVTEFLVTKVNPGGFWVGIWEKMTKSNKRISLIKESKENELFSTTTDVKALQLYLIKDMDLEDDYVFLQCLPALLLKALIRRWPGW